MERSFVRGATAVFAVSAALLLALSLGGGDFFNALDDVLPFTFAAAALLALAGLAHERGAAAGRAVTQLQKLRDSEERAGGLERALQESEAERDKLERKLREEEDTRRHEQRMRLRVERARQAEREWARELREQVLALHRRQGAIGDPGDIHELVLRIAIELVGAEKGLLLSRRDQDRDGKLDLVTHQGFEHDPGDSDVAQRFAERVLKRDEIVREDEPGTGHSPADREIECLIAVPVYMNEEFEGVVVCANRPAGFEELDNDVLLALGDHAGTVLENARLHGDLHRTHLGIVRMLSDSVATKDPFVRTHSGHISTYVDAVAKRLGLQAREREQLVFATLLRDIGKLAISERILLKPKPLTSEEWDLVRLHPQIGCRIVERVPGLGQLGPAIRHHHERWDGTGYPSRLARAEIPLPARIVAVADAFGAMVGGRPYRASITVEAACWEILRGAGTQFDPEIAEMFVEEVRRRPLDVSDAHPVAEALDEPAVQARRKRDEPVLGYGAVGATDNVTLLYSQRYLLEYAEFEAERARRHRRPFAVVMVELSDLAGINRRQGYAAGDAALCEVARALEQVMPGTRATAGRYSGRRLAAILPDSGHHAGTAAVERLMGAIDDGGPVVRAAVTVWHQGDGGETVLSRARLALETGAAVAPQT